MTISDVYRIINTHTHIHSDKVSHIYRVYMGPIVLFYYFAKQVGVARVT